MQQKMSTARNHVQSRIIQITNLLAPPLDHHKGKEPETKQNSNGAAQTLPATEKPTQPESSNTCTPPIYQDAMCEEVSADLPPYTEDDPETMRRSATSDSIGSSEQGEILFSMESVQVLCIVSSILSSCGPLYVFHVSASGEVTTPSYPETLHLTKFDRENKRIGAELPPAFIEVGEWTYPLVTGKSPILKADYGKRSGCAVNTSNDDHRRIHVP
jgi:hypothetical protein